MITPIKPVDTSFRHRADADKQLHNVIKSVKQEKNKQQFKEVLDRILYNEGC